MVKTLSNNIIIILTFVAFQMEVLAVEANEIAGTYLLSLAEQISPDQKKYQAVMVIKEGDEYTLVDKGIYAKDLKCRGQYEFDGDLFFGSMRCPNHGIYTPVSHLINLTGVTLQQLKTGVRVKVRSNLFKFKRYQNLLFEIQKFD